MFAPGKSLILLNCCCLFEHVFWKRSSWPRQGQCGPSLAPGSPLRARKGLPILVAGPSHFLVNSVAGLPNLFGLKKKWVKNKHIQDTDNQASHRHAPPKPPPTRPPEPPHTTTTTTTTTHHLGVRGGGAKAGRGQARAANQTTHTV